MNWAKSYIYAGSRLLSTITKSGSSELTEYHHPDRLGTKLVTDSTANTAKSQSTLPFGALIPAETQATTNQKFTSYDRSGATGLDYAVNRTYNSGQSRFTQVDPIGMASASIGDPQSLNMFAYTQNNPVDFVDPSGLTDILWTGYLAALEALENRRCREFIGRGLDFGDRDPRDILRAYISQKLIGASETYDTATGARRFANAGPGAITTRRFNTRGGITLPSSTSGSGTITLNASQITINSNGFFFSLKDAGGRAVNTIPGAGFEQLHATQIRGAIVLHELAHAIGSIATDGKSKILSRINSFLVKRICFSPIPDQQIESEPAKPSTEISPMPTRGLPRGSQGGVATVSSGGGGSSYRSIFDLWGNSSGSVTVSYDERKSKVHKMALP